MRVRVAQTSIGTLPPGPNKQAFFSFFFLFSFFLERVWRPVRFSSEAALARRCARPLVSFTCARPLRLRWWLGGGHEGLEDTGECTCAWRSPPSGRYPLALINKLFFHFSFFSLFFLERVLEASEI